MTSNTKITCRFCGQDWLHRYRLISGKLEFLICRECDAVWLLDEDTSTPPGRFLDDLLKPEDRDNAWNFIEPG